MPDALSKRPSSRGSLPARMLFVPDVRSPPSSLDLGRDGKRAANESQARRFVGGPWVEGTEDPSY